MQGKNCEQDFGRLFPYVSEVSHNLRRECAVVILLIILQLTKIGQRFLSYIPTNFITTWYI